MILDEEYERVEKFWNFLSLRKLSDLNDLYSFQGTIIICKMFENRAEEMMKNFLYNQQKCTSASSLSACIHHHFSKLLISLKNTGWICGDVPENTYQLRQYSLGIWLENSFSKRPGRQAKGKLQLIYKIRNLEANVYEDKRFIPKILKMDENN